MNLIETFQRYIEDNSLATHDDRILLTVSGGVDSMVMLSLFTRCGYRVGVAHCNFQLRGTESDEDEVLVEEEAKKYGVEFYNKRFETKAEMERTGESMEMAARRLRYAWFDALSHEHGYTAVAIAHHADDSIETFFINLLRGTGLRGLTGISTQVGKIIRPLLFASRREILEYAVAEPHPLPGGFVEPLDQIPAQQDPAGAHPPHPRDQPQVHEPDEPQPRAADRRPAVHQPRHRAHPRRGGHVGGGDRHDPPRPDRPGVPAGVRDLRTPQFGIRVQGRRDRLAVPRPRTGGHGTAVLRPGTRGLHRPRTDRRGAGRPRRRVSHDGAERSPAQLLRQLGALLRILRHRHDQEFRRPGAHRADRRRPAAIPAHAPPLAGRRLVRALRHDGPQEGVATSSSMPKSPWPRNSGSSCSCRAAKSRGSSAAASTTATG